MDFSRGSEWRKWDLHLHTASSYDYGYKAKDSDKLLIDALRRNCVSAICVTDHFVLDADRIVNLRNLAPEIVVFPGIELRTDKGDTNIHMILIFDEKSNLDELAEDVRVFKREKGQEIDNDEKTYWDFKDIVNFAEKHGAIISVHAGRKSNGVDRQITNALEHNQAVKDEYDKYVHIYEMGKEEDLDEYRKYVFATIREKPMVICSDNHDPRSYVTKVPLWIKADLTFEGLKQILIEPEERVRVQTDSPEYDFDKSPFTQINIQGETDVFADNDDVHFAPTRLQLNSSLVSIIGGRGAGKSVLVDFLATGLGQNEAGKNYNIPNEKVRVLRKTALNEAEKELSFDGLKQVPFVYISQSQVKDLVKDSKAFTKDLRETIGVMEDYACPSELMAKIETAVNEYYRLKKFLYSDETAPEEKKIRLKAEVSRYQQFIERITSDANQKALSEYSEIVRKKETAERFRAELEDFVNNVQIKEAVINEEIARLNSKAKKLEPIPTVNLGKIKEHVQSKWVVRVEEYIKRQIERIHEIKSRFPDYSGDLASLLSNVSRFQAQLIILEKQLEEIERHELQFSEFKKNGFRDVGCAIKKSLDGYKEKIEMQWAKFHNGLPELSEERRLLLTDILKEEDFAIRVEIQINIEEMYSLLLDKLDRRRYSIKRLQETLKIDTLESYYRFIVNEGEKNAFSDDVDITLREQIFKVLYVQYAQFIKHNIIVESHGRAINKLSYGQQGTIYLKLKIAANLFMETLVYDQPEDDLDNQFITEELVKLFRKIKKYRQVIIVSHNANLVVNADSEQVIVASNEDGVLRYHSGALENPLINEAVCKILEGGAQAFINREQKYKLSSAL